jgi:hypothetical protein
MITSVITRAGQRSGIVKETIKALQVNNTVADQETKNRRDAIVRVKSL